MTITGVLFSTASACVLACSLATSALAQDFALTQPVKFAALESAPVSKTTDFSVFTPRPQSVSSRIDYSTWDDALSKVVLDLGPSTRQRARKPMPQVGTKMVKGHKTAYRLEGARFTFAYLNDTYIAGLTDYRKDLEEIGTDYDITRFSKNEQLAYWINLHNVALIEKVALAYPIDQPTRIDIRVDGEKYDLHDAPFITVKGQRLSLKDIRENIVYTNWSSNPNVIYGFFRGDIGSPILTRYAFTGDETERFLNQSADEFVNSLRGFNDGSRTRNISEIYQEAAPYFFKNFDRDLDAHLRVHANSDVTEELNSGKPFKVERYDTMIADLSGGQRLGSSGNAISGGTNVPFEVSRMLTEVRDKKQYLRRQGLLNSSRGYVIIEDLVPEEKKTQPPE